MMMLESRRKIHRAAARCMVFVALGLLAACETPAPKPPAERPPVIVTPPAPPAPAAAEPVPPPPAVPETPAAVSVYRPADWTELPGWREDNQALAWKALLAGCAALTNRDEWHAPCSAAAQMSAPDAQTARSFFERFFTPYRIANTDGTEEGLITGYYEPLLRGSRKPSRRYRYPVYGVPDDLLVVDLAEAYPQLKGMRLRGRIEGRRVVPYYDRSQIDNGVPGVRGKEIAWVDDPMELFFLQIQGSGRIKLANGAMVRVGYAEQNGYPYRSIGRWLVERGELPLEKASMQGIKEWAKQHPDQLKELLNYNASYVFFRELPADLPGPIGALGVALTAGRSIAVDARYVPLGVPVYVVTTWPNSTRPLNRLTLAQDKGGAIRGAVRADFFWGYGEEAAREAGRMKQALRVWVLLPKGSPVPAVPE